MVNVTKQRVECVWLILYSVAIEITDVVLTQKRNYRCCVPEGIANVASLLAWACHCLSRGSKFESQSRWISAFPFITFTSDKKKK